MNDNFLLPIYLRKEERNGIKGVGFYADAERTQFRAFSPWWNSLCPTKRNKYVMFNCYRWRAIWD